METFSFFGLGAVDCGRESFDYLLDKRKRGNAMAVAVGGSAEVFDMHPRMMRLTLQRRKGFIRMALKHGFVSWFASFSIFPMNLFPPCL